MPGGCFFHKTRHCALDKNFQKKQGPAGNKQGIGFRHIFLPPEAD